IALAGSWTGFSEQPTFADARGSTETLVSALQATSENEIDGTPGIDELYVVYPRFESMVAQVPTVVQVSPVKVDEVEQPDSGSRSDSTAESESAKADGPQPLYEF